MIKMMSTKPPPPTEPNTVSPQSGEDIMCVLNFRNTENFKLNEPVLGYQF